MKEARQEVLEAEMTGLLGAGPHERQDGRQGERAGHDERGLGTRIGKLELRVARDRMGAIPDRPLRALPALGEGVRGRLGGDGCARCLHTEGEGHHRGALRAQFLGLEHQRHP